MYRGLVALLACWPQGIGAVGAGDPPLDLKGLSLEELMDLTVTLASRKEQALSQAPAAIAAITAQDIRRFGAQSIAEALRLVPGMQVARIDASKWAVSSRGFNSRFANKLLVQVDGRSVYTPLFSGVYWEAQDVLLDDVARIEVVRGPGATLWGANAVDGLVNVVGKQAQDTQGNLAIVGGGVEERGFGAVRHGGQLGEGLYYRVWAKYFDRDALIDGAGQSAGDGWFQGRSGFRLDGRRGGTFLSQLFLDATTPSYQGLLHSGWDIARDWAFDLNCAMSMRCPSSVSTAMPIWGRGWRISWVRGRRWRLRVRICSGAARNSPSVSCRRRRRGWSALFTALSAMVSDVP